MIPPHLAPLAQCPRCAYSLAQCQCGTTPAAPVMKPPARTFVKMGAYMICQRCQFAVQYCRCGELLDAEKPLEDGPAAQSLAQRIAEVKK